VFGLPVQFAIANVDQLGQLVEPLVDVFFDQSIDEFAVDGRVIGDRMADRVVRFQIVRESLGRGRLRRDPDVIQFVSNQRRVPESFGPVELSQPDFMNRLDADPAETNLDRQVTLAGIVNESPAAVAAKVHPQLETGFGVEADGCSRGQMRRPSAA